MNESTIALICFIAFAVMWCLIVFLISLVSGWHKAAKKYRFNNETAETVKRFCSARINVSDYGSCLTIGTNPEGLLLRMIPPFNIGHTPLFIPFCDITARAETRLLGRTSIILTVKTLDRFEITISEKLAGKILPITVLDNLQKE